MSDLHSAEEVFYSRYDWCLNPILSVQELLHRFSEEISNYSSFDGWQREECQINLYLFACALACTIDDYFGMRLLDLSAFYSCVPRLLFWLRPAHGRIVFCAPHDGLPQTVELVAGVVVQHPAKEWHLALGTMAVEVGGATSRPRPRGGRLSGDGSDIAPDAPDSPGVENKAGT